MAPSANAANADELANIARMSNYAFVYGVLLALGNLAIVCSMTILAFPLDGQFGGLAVSRMLFRLMAIGAAMLGMYAFSSYSVCDTRHAWTTSFRLFFVAFLYGVLSLIIGPAPMPEQVDVLRWIGTACSACAHVFPS